MSTSITVAELLISVGLDAAQANAAAGKLEKTVEGAARGQDKLAKETDKADAALDRFATTAKHADKIADMLSKALLAAGAALVGIGAKVLKTGEEFQDLEARLKTVTGSAEAADRAFGFVKTFAQDVPFSVQTVTDSFIKLKGAGIDPTIETLTAFSDISSGNAKDLNQFTEAALDAAQGEFERLREFNIKASKHGDQVAFRFKGITTLVDDNAKAITDHLISIGQTDFAGASAERMEKIGGSLSRAADSFAFFLNEVAQSGPIEEFKALLKDVEGESEGLAKTLANLLTKAIREVRRLVEDGRLNKAIKSTISLLEFFVDNWGKMVAVIAGAKTLSAINSAAQAFGKLGLGATGALGPIGAIAAAMLALIPIATSVGDAIGDVFAAAGQTGARQGKRVRSGLTLGQMTSEERSQIEALDAKIKQLDESGAGLVPAGAKQLQDLQAQRRAVADSAEARHGTARDAAEAQAQEDAAFAAQQDAALDAQLDDAPVGPEFVKSAIKKGRRKGSRAPTSKPKITSPVTISEFFKAAAVGDLGPISARAPSAQGIEPTVAIDITNNNYSFSDTFNIRGTGDAGEIGKSVARQVRMEFQGRLAKAGQAMAPVMER